MEKLNVLDDDDVPVDELGSFRPFYTDPAASRATNGSYREDCAGGMYPDSGRLYRSSFRAYPSSRWYVKIRMAYELYGCWAVRSVYESSQYIWCSDCNSADAAHA